jgi:hypothetical protein
MSYSYDIRTYTNFSTFGGDDAWNVVFGLGDLSPEPVEADDEQNRASKRHP